MTDPPAPAPQPSSNPLGGIIANIFGGGGHKSDDDNASNIETCTDMEFLISQAQADLQCIERGEMGDEPAHEQANTATSDGDETKADKQHPTIMDTARLSGGSTEFGRNLPAKEDTEEAEERMRPTRQTLRPRHPHRQPHRR